MGGGECEDPSPDPLPQGEGAWIFVAAPPLLSPIKKTRGFSSIPAPSPCGRG
ncbi:hypothetical protein FRZ44_08020 [Hypericibacter terrae]|uniref:Uncharacterized protein n=1 Tax=Hypericibacter terrae TaxID=2602015 RepID=A0A5J6MDM4_9PROT|nr:hypothetical protein FRZ44_08020 [Hypericibacter terrae]